MNEQEFINHLRKETENTPIPESLTPENICKQLSSDNNVPKPHRRWYQSPWLYTAASLLLCITGLWSVLYINRSHVSDSASSPINESASKDALLPETADDANETADTVVYDETAYRELFQILKDNSALRYSHSFNVETLTEDTNAAESAAEDSVKELLDTSARTYSDTNSQLTTVAEADIVKTDGTYIFSCFSQSDSLPNAVAITHTKQGSLTACSVISEASIMKELPEETDFNIEEMYLDNQKLILICNVYDDASTPDNTIYNNAVICVDLAVQCSNTCILTYDVSNPKNPVCLSALMQDGAYMDSRLSDGYLYTFTSKYVILSQDSSYNKESFPHTNNRLLAYDDICLPACADGSCFQIITGLSLEDSTDFTASKAVLADSGTYYVSPDYIYFAHQALNGETEWIRFAYTDGQLTAKGELTLDGTILNQFSMDEYEGYLRVAVTTSHDGTTTNALYIINPDMELCGTISDLAPNERIYSVRFMGETAYCVTYREMDPLFAIDLSNPKNPTVTDTLKLPGFSNYLHFYSDTLLLGIGEETNPDTGERMGIKLSMFDITDPYCIREVDTVVLSDMYFTPVQYDHKALLIDSDKNLIGFYGECYNRDTYDYSHKYLIYSYSVKNGFQERFQCNVAEDSILSYGLGKQEPYFYDMRGLYINDSLYLVNGNRICSYSLRDFSRKEGLVVCSDGKHISTTDETTN